MSSNPTPNSIFFFTFFGDSGDFDNVKVYILEKKNWKKNEKINWSIGKIACKLYDQILFIGKTYPIILPRTFIGNTYL